MGATVLQQAQLQGLLKTFKEQHAEEYHLRALGYFGSCARNEANEDSDVNIVFETDAPNLFRTSRMRLDLEELLGRSVDVVRLRECMNPRMKARVEKEAILSDSQLLTERLTSMLEALERIPRRFSEIHAPSDFSATDAGIDRMESRFVPMISDEFGNLIHYHPTAPRIATELWPWKQVWHGTIGGRTSV